MQDTSHTTRQPVAQHADLLSELLHQGNAAGAPLPHTSTVTRFEVTLQWSSLNDAETWATLLGAAQFGEDMRSAKYLQRRASVLVDGVEVVLVACWHLGNQVAS